MRRALWIFSAPVVAGGLAWAVNATDNAGPLLAGAPQAQNGKIIYFSRGGKPAAEPSASDADDTWAVTIRPRFGTTAAAPSASDADDTLADNDTADAETAETPAAPQRFVRNRPSAAATTVAATSTESGSAAASGVKNYKDLFTNSETSAGSNAARQTAARRLPKPANPSATPNKRAIIEECGVDAASDADSAREEVQLPAVSKNAGAKNAGVKNAGVKNGAARNAGGKNQQVAGTREAAGVRHAELRTGDSSAKHGVQQAQNIEQVSAKRHASKTAPTDPPADDGDSAAPVPPPAPKAAKSTKEAPAKANRPATTSVARPAAGAQAKLGRKPQPAAQKTRPAVTQVAAEDARESAAPAASENKVISAAASDDVPMVSLRWTKIDEINVNQECKCGLVIKNSGKLVAKDIVVEAYFPRSVRLIDANPFPNDSKDHLVWIFEHLDPGQEKTVDITMIPSRRGELATSATVRFTGVATSVVTVEEPQIGLAINGAHNAMVGETLVQTIVVSNAGTGIAHDVVVHAKIPEGLEHPRGKVVEMGIGSLGPGESRELRLPLAAVAGCDAVLVVEARGSSNLSQTAQSAIKIAAPKLSVEVAGPGLRYIGRHAQYVVTVTNEGVAATDNVRIVHLVPEGFDFLKADKGGKFEASTGSVNWFIGRLEAGESQQVSTDLNARQTGEFLHHVQATGESGTMAAAKAATRVDGSSKVVMEVADLDDPVEIGTQTAYEIRIRNDGSKASQGLRIACELPDGVELIDTKGPTEHFLEKGVLHFKPLAELAAGAKTTYLIRVNGKVAGNLRLRAKLTSTASPEPIIVEEITKFYAD